MKKPLFILLAFLFFNQANSQSAYIGLNFDFNSTLHTRHTYAAGLHAEARLGKKSNWYANWDFAFGANVETDLYARANILILCYGDPNYWRNIGNNTNSIGEFFGVLLAPLICPVGISNYFYTSYNKDLRLGFYLNPMQLDYWDAKNPIRSWSIHGGLKLIYNWQGNANIYLKVGGINLYNTFNYKNANDENGVLFNFSVGTVFNTD